jgi:hypothetical protein
MLLVGYRGSVATLLGGRSRAAGFLKGFYSPMLIFLLLLSLFILLFSTSLSPLLALAIAPAFWAHLIFVVAALPLIMAAMQHFVPVLTRSRAAGRALGGLPVGLGLAGVSLLGVFAGKVDWAWIMPLAILIAAGAAWQLLWMRQRATAALGGAHPGLAWYVAAVACLIAGLTAAALIPVFPDWHAPLRQFHLHINLFGFVGLTAVGTLQVLFPTATGHADVGVNLRLRQDLKWALTGAVLLSLGRALELPALTVLGALCWLWPMGRMAWAWWRQGRVRILSWQGAPPVLAAAVVGLALAVVGVVVPGVAPLDVFVAGFMFPLVSGAATQLVPVWLRPGRQTAWHTRARQAIGRYNGVRALLYLTSAVLPLLGYRCGAMAGLLALFWFVAGFGYWWLMQGGED